MWTMKTLRYENVDYEDCEGVKSNVFVVLFPILCHQLPCDQLGKVSSTDSNTIHTLYKDWIWTLTYSQLVCEQTCKNTSNKRLRVMEISSTNPPKRLFLTKPIPFYA